MLGIPAFTWALAGKPGLIDRACSMPEQGQCSINTRQEQTACIPQTWALSLPLLLRPHKHLHGSFVPVHEEGGQDEQAAARQPPQHRHIEGPSPAHQGYDQAGKDIRCMTGCAWLVASRSAQAPAAGDLGKQGPSTSPTYRRGLSPCPRRLI